MDTDTVIGHNVHQLLWERRVEQKTLYNAMGMSRSSLAKKMRGEVAWSAADIRTAADVPGVDPGELFRPPPQRMAARPAPVTSGNQAQGPAAGTGYLPVPVLRLASVTPIRRARQAVAA
jgi:hypothetical protein